MLIFCIIYFCFCQQSKARRQKIAEILNSEFIYVWFGSYFFPISRTFVVKTYKLLQTTRLCFQLDTISIFLFCNEQLFKVADCCEIGTALLTPLPQRCLHFSGGGNDLYLFLLYKCKIIIIINEVNCRAAAKQPHQFLDLLFSLTTSR